MNVKIEGRACAAPKPTFPCIRKAKDSSLIVLFTDRETGMRLAHGKNTDRPLFVTEHDWIEYDNTEHWEPFVGTITLSND